MKFLLEFTASILFLSQRGYQLEKSWAGRWEIERRRAILGVSPSRHELEFQLVPKGAPKREFQHNTPAGRERSRNIYAAETGAGATFDKTSRPQRSIRSVVSQLMQESVRETP